MIEEAKSHIVAHLVAVMSERLAELKDSDSAKELGIESVSESAVQKAAVVALESILGKL